MVHRQEEYTTERQKTRKGNLFEQQQQQQHQSKRQPAASRDKLGKTTSP